MSEPQRVSDGSFARVKSSVEIPGSQGLASVFPPSLGQHRMSKWYGTTLRANIFLRECRRSQRDEKCGRLRTYLLPRTLTWTAQTPGPFDGPARAAQFNFHRDFFFFFFLFVCPALMQLGRKNLCAAKNTGDGIKERYDKEKSV